MGDVGEGAAVDQGGSALQRLDKIRLESIFQQRRHSAGCLQIMGGNGCTVIGIAHNNAAQARLQIGQGGGKAQYRHDLTGHRDIVAVIAGDAVCFAAQTDGNAAQDAVIHIHGTPPGNALRVDAEGVALMNVVVDHGGQEIVGCADGMEVAGEVEVNVLHGDDLCVAAAGRAAFYAEYRA